MIHIWLLKYLSINTSTQWIACGPSRRVGGAVPGGAFFTDPGGTGAAAAVAVEEEEEEECEEEGRGEQKEGGGQAATGSQTVDSSSVSTNMSFLAPGPQEARAGDLKDTAVKSHQPEKKQEVTSWHW